MVDRPINEAYTGDDWAFSHWSVDWLEIEMRILVFSVFVMAPSGVAIFAKVSNR
jgi:hypothetical protein